MTRRLTAILLVALLFALLANAGDLNSDLIEAVNKGDTVAVEALLAGGADVNAKDNTGRTTLMLAAVGGHSATVEALLTAGPDVNAMSKTGQTALLLAAMRGHTDIVELLKKAGAKE